MTQAAKTTRNNTRSKDTEIDLVAFVRLLTRQSPAKLIASKTADALKKNKVRIEIRSEADSRLSEFDAEARSVLTQMAETTSALGLAREDFRAELRSAFVDGERLLKKAGC